MTRSPAPLTLRLATIIVGIEVVVVWLFVAVLAVAAASGGADRAEHSAVLRQLGYFAIYAVALPILGWALLRRCTWIRAPLIVVQFLWVVVGFTLLGTYLLGGIAVIVLAVACVGLLLTPSVRAAIGAR